MRVNAPTSAVATEPLATLTSLVFFTTARGAPGTLRAAAARRSYEVASHSPIMVNFGVVRVGPKDPDVPMWATLHD